MSDARRLVLGALVLAAVVAVAAFLPWREAVADVVVVAERAGPAGAVGFGALYAVATVLAVPGSLLTLAAGLAWGPWVGFLVVWPGATLGAIAAFALGRTVLRSRAEALLARHARLAALDRAVGERGFLLVLLLRLSPIFPFAALNYALGATRVSARDHALATAVGIVPGALLYVVAGSTLQSLADPRPDTGPAGKVLAVVGLVATVVVTTFVTRLARRALAAQEGAAEEGT